MITVNEAKRLVKRALLSNIVSEKRDLAITPLVSGKHGIGKSAMMKSIAKDLGGTCITVEGGTLKEGEITGLPYQYKDENGQIRFRFLPYYAVERIQDEEKRIYESVHGCSAVNEDHNILDGDENRYAMNDLTPQERIDAIRSGRVHLVIIFIDEINRTENTVYRELMNILLTRSVNGYRFPWWVLFAGAMNPGTQNSIYATNDMDPAQLDRFLKIKVSENTAEWLRYAKKSGMSESIRSFIKENPKCLSSDARELDDDEKPSPSPRGWDMADTILSAEPMLRVFFTDKENTESVVQKDMKKLLSAKLGTSAATMFFASLVSKAKALSPEELIDDDEKLSKCQPVLAKMSPAKKVQTCDLMINYLKENIEFMMLDRKAFAKLKKQLSVLAASLDSSTRLLFAQNMAAAVSNEGNNLIELFFDVFESDLIKTLDLSESTRKAIKGSV